MITGGILFLILITLFSGLISNFNISDTQSNDDLEDFSSDEECLEKDKK